MSCVRSSWCTSLRLGMVMAGFLQAGVAVESTPQPPQPAPLSASAAATNEIDTLLAELTPPGSSAQVLAITQVFERGTVAEKERLLVGLGTASMTNTLSLVVSQAGSEDPVVALAALRACHDLGPATRDELNQVHLALRSADSRVQTRAAILLAHLEDETSLKLLVNRLGSVTVPESKATLDFLHELSGVELGDTAQPWQTWMEAELQAADAKIPQVIQGLASKDPELVIVALKEGSILRLRRSELVSSIVPLLGHADAKVAGMAELCLKVMGGPVAKGALKTWLTEHPLTQTSTQILPAAVTPPPQAPTIAAHFHLSSGTQDFLFISGLIFVFWMIFMILGRPTKKALLKIDQVTGGHVTRRIVMAKAQGQAAIKRTTTFFKRGATDSSRLRQQQVPTPALIRKTPLPGEITEHKQARKPINVQGEKA